MWIENSIKKSKNLRKHYKLHDIDIFIKDNLPEFVDPNYVFLYVAKRISSHLLKGIDIIYVGKFANLEKKGANALYEDGAIYISNRQDNEMDMIDDLIHEVAHSNEKIYQDIIYGDGRLESEFKAKRKRLYKLLTDEYDIKCPLSLAHSIDYKEELEEFLYDTVGYNVLNRAVTGLFNSTYSTVSIKEYFARGFEHYFLGQQSELKQVSPILYDIIETLDTLEDN